MKCKNPNHWSPPIWLLGWRNKGYLVELGYKTELVDKQFANAKEIPRKELLKPSLAKTRELLFPVLETIRYNPNLSDTNAIL